MNNTVTLSQLITRLAAKTGTDPNTTRRFLRTFFASIEASLIEGHSVTINGIGTFRRPADALESTAPVIFVPDAALAEEINAPFAMFEPVELADGVEFAPVEEAVQIEDTEVVDTEVVDTKVVDTEVVDTEVMDTESTAPAAETATSAEPEPPVVPAAQAPAAKIEEPYIVPLGAADDEEEDTPKPVHHHHSSHHHAHHHHYNRHYTAKKKPNTYIWIVGAIAIAAVCVAAYFAAIYVTSDEFQMYQYDTDEPSATEQSAENTPVFEEVSVDEVTSQSVAPVESNETVAETTRPTEAIKTETKPATATSSAEPRTDTVTSTRYLATMARQYYGKSIYWVFIYQANADHLNNPNRIKPGTVVIIPEKETFMEATDEATVRKAEKIKAELDRRFN